MPAVTWPRMPPPVATWTTWPATPGFLLTADPGAVLAQRANLRTPGGRRALAAFDLGLHDWEAATPAARLDRLAANAARVHAHALSAACRIAGSEWPVRWAAWTGQGHRRLADHDDPVNAVAIGRAGDRDIIVSGSDDGTVRSLGRGHRRPDRRATGRP